VLRKGQIEAELDPIKASFISKGQTNPPAAKCSQLTCGPSIADTEANREKKQRGPSVTAFSERDSRLSRMGAGWA
jgi:hypothetical protein